MTKTTISPRARHSLSPLVRKAKAAALAMRDEIDRARCNAVRRQKQGRAWGVCYRAM